MALLTDNNGKEQLVSREHLLDIHNKHLSYTFGGFHAICICQKDMIKGQVFWYTVYSLIYVRQDVM